MISRKLNNFQVVLLVLFIVNCLRICECNIWGGVPCCTRSCNIEMKWFSDNRYFKLIRVGARSVYPV